jgi:hypothetical protein
MLSYKLCFFNNHGSEGGDGDKTFIFYNARYLSSNTIHTLSSTGRVSIYGDTKRIFHQNLI